MLKVGMWWMGLLWKVIDEDLECGYCEMGEGAAGRDGLYIHRLQQKTHLSVGPDMRASEI
jgi:hypothetical protein